MEPEAMEVEGHSCLSDDTKREIKVKEKIRLMEEEVVYKIPEALPLLSESNLDTNLFQCKHQGSNPEAFKVYQEAVNDKGNGLQSADIWKLRSSVKLLTQMHSEEKMTCYTLYHQLQRKNHQLNLMKQKQEASDERIREDREGFQRTSDDMLRKVNEALQAIEESKNKLTALEGFSKKLEDAKSQVVYLTDIAAKKEQQLEERDLEVVRLTDTVDRIQKQLEERDIEVVRLSVIIEKIEQEKSISGQQGTNTSPQSNAETASDGNSTPNPTRDLKEWSPNLSNSTIIETEPDTDAENLEAEKSVSFPAFPESSQKASKQEKTINHNIMTTTEKGKKSKTKESEVFTIDDEASDDDIMVLSSPSTKTPTEAKLEKEIEKLKMTVEHLEAFRKKFYEAFRVHKRQKANNKEMSDELNKLKEVNEKIIAENMRLKERLKKVEDVDSELKKMKATIDNKTKHGIETIGSSGSDTSSPKANKGSRHRTQR